MSARIATLAFAVGLLLVGLLTRPVPISGTALLDFEAYYAAGATWQYHGDPYGRDVWRTERTIPTVDGTHDEFLPFVGPPFGLPLWAALARLDWHWASTLWGGAMAVAFGVIALGSLRIANERIDAIDAGAVLAMAAGFGPLTSGVALGQAAVVSCAAIVLTPLALRRRSAFGAAATALVAALQPNLAIVLAARAGSRRAAIAFALALALALGGSALALAGSGGLGRYLEVLRAHAASERFIAIQTTSAAVARGFGASPETAGLCALGIALVTFAVLAVQCASRRYAPDDRLALACAALPLTLPFAHEHDFTIAFLPIVLLLRRARGTAWVVGAIAGAAIAVDWLGLAQRPGGVLETVLLTTGVTMALACLAREPLRPFHFVPLLVPAAVAVAGAFVFAHPLPTWPGSLPANFHVPPGLDAAQAWRAEQLASGVGGLDARWALLRALSLGGCALLWCVASTALLSSRTQATRSEPASTALRRQQATSPSA